MRKKILAFVFTAALLVAMAVPLFGGGGTAQAIVDPVVPSDECSSGQQSSSNAAGGLNRPNNPVGFPAVPQMNPGTGLPENGGATNVDPC